MTSQQPIATVPKELVEELKKKEEETFRDWLSSPLTKIVLSTMPPTENDVLIELLRAAFQHGSNCGRSSGLLLMLAAARNGPGDQPPRG